jgi:hypothetical protein
MLEAHVTAIESSVVFRILRHMGRPLLDHRTWTAKWLARSPLHVLEERSPDGQDFYARWIEQPTSDEPPPSRGSISFCILLTVQNPCREWLGDAVESIRSQSHAAWELWSAPKIWLPEYLTAISSADHRIHTVRIDEDLGLVGTLNKAAASSSYLLTHCCGLQPERRPPSSTPTRTTSTSKEFGASPFSSPIGRPISSSPACTLDD